MKTREQDIEEAKALGHGGNCTVFWSEEGGGDVYRIWDTLFLFSIPQYGGEGSFEGAFQLDEIEKLVDLARTWT
jgi:hypothetical protein